MKKKLIAILMTMALAASALIGCGSSADNNAGADNAPQDGGNEEVVEINLWHGYATEKAEKLEEFVEKYNAEHTDVKIVPKFVASGEEMLQKVQSSIMGGQQPDLLWGFPTWTGVLESTGKLVAIDDILEEDYKAEIPEGLWNVGKYDGKYYSIPVEAGTLLLIYNKDMFEEAGIEKAPETWEELYEDAKLLTNDERKGIWMPITPDERTTWTWLCFLGQNGGQLLNDDYTAPGFDREVGKEALEYYTKFVTEGYAPVSIGQDPFVEEEVAMVIATQGAAGSYIDKYGMNVGVAMLPGNKELATGLGSNHYFIFDNGDEKKIQASYEFVKWMTTGDVQAEWSTSVGYLPVSESAKNSEFFQNYVAEKDYMQTAADALTYGLARPSIEEYTQISAEIGSVIEEIAYGKTDADGGIDKIIDKINSLLNK